MTAGNIVGAIVGIAVAVTVVWFAYMMLFKRY
jgi:hypothetical protein